MNIKVYILEKKVKGQYIKPIEYEFKGNYALEFMFIRLADVYFGQKISLEIESSIKKRVDE